MGASANGHSRQVAVPRVWLILLTVLTVAPWGVLAAIWLWPTHASAPPAPRDTMLSSGPTEAVGAWGRLETRPILISPPLEFVPRNWGTPLPSAWTFPAATADEARAFLVASGMSGADADRVRATARPTPEVDGITFRPDADLVHRLEPDVRARIYLALAAAVVKVDQNRTPINFDQVTAYRFHGQSVEEWLGGEPLLPETRALVAPLVYRKGGFMYFADMELIRARIQDPEQVQWLAKRLMRFETMLARLMVDPDRIDAITEYWGRGGRRTDIRPILESVARHAAAADDPSASIDISHLLPRFARLNLYRYPAVTPRDLEQPLLVNCLWSALNFFSDEPDDRFLDVRFALTTLQNDYIIVNDNYQLGDIVAFTDPEGDLVHVAVYLAGDLVFSKNGTTPLAPWSILPIEHLNGHYPEHSDAWTVSYHRRKGL